jgi:hypothetical protein
MRPALPNARFYPWSCQRRAVKQAYSEGWRHFAIGPLLLSEETPTNGSRIVAAKPSSFW